MHNKKGQVIWITGLSGSGKTTLANALNQRLKANQFNICVLDGDIIRKGLCSDLGYSQEDRIENIRRAAEVCKILISKGFIVIASFISPTQKIRHLAREIIIPYPFTEVYLNTPLMVCEQRDIKGLYEKARNGEIQDFTGISAIYEEPANADIVLDTSKKTLEECVAEVIAKI